MNIVYLTLVDVSKPTGPGTNELESICALIKRQRDNQELTFLLPSVPSELDSMSPNILCLNVEERVIRGFSLLVWQFQYLIAFVNIFRTFEKLKNTIVVIRPDSAGKLLLIPIWLRSKKIKYGFRHIQDQMNTQADGLVKKWYVNKLSTWAFNHAEFIDTPQQKCLTNLLESGFKNIAIIGNAVNLERFKLDNKQDSRGKTNFPNNDFIVGYIGGLPLDRGATQMIESASELIKLIPEIHFVVVGDSKFKNESHIEKMKIMVKEIGLMDRFTFVGTIPYTEISPYFNSLDVGIALVPTNEVKLKGNSSQKIYQYLACGAPVIVPANTHEDLVSKKVAMQVTPESIEDFIAAILVLYKNRIDRNYIRGIAELYSVEIRADKQLDLWEKALKK